MVSRSRTIGFKKLYDQTGERKLMDDDHDAVRKERNAIGSMLIGGSSLNLLAHWCTDEKNGFVPSGLFASEVSIRAVSPVFSFLLLEYVRAFANERIVLLLQMKRRWTEYLVSYTNICFLFFQNETLLTTARWPQQSVRLFCRSVFSCSSGILFERCAGNVILNFF